MPWQLTGTENTQGWSVYLTVWEIFIQVNNDRYDHSWLLEHPKMNLDQPLPAVLNCLRGIS